MIIDIMSRNQVLAFSSAPHDEKTAVISISNMGVESPRLTQRVDNGIIVLLELHFDDVESISPRCMTDRQARMIAEFVFEFRDKVDRIVVSCEAGISRSAGVAAAIMKYLNKLPNQHHACVVKLAAAGG